MKSVYRHYSQTIADGEFYPINVWGKFIILLSNTASTHIKISIASEEFEDLPAGISVRLTEDNKFTDLKFKNVSGATCTITFAVSAGEIIDNRTVIAGALPVVNISNAITTPVPLTALDVNFLINNAAAVNKGGGKVGIPLTNQPFATGEILTIANTINYNGVAFVVDATSTTNEVVITATYAAETFDGTNDSIGLTTPRSIAADTTQKEIIIQNADGNDVWFGDSNVDVAAKRGTKLQPNDNIILDLTAAVFVMSDGAGVAGNIVSLNRLQNV